MTLQDNEPRCLAYDTPAPMRKKLPHWCDLRETCARALAIRTDKRGVTTPIEYRVCAVGKTDKHIEVTA